MFIYVIYIKDIKDNIAHKDFSFLKGAHAQTVKFN